MQKIWINDFRKERVNQEKQYIGIRFGLTLPIYIYITFLE